FTSFTFPLKPRPIFYLSFPGHSSRTLVVTHSRLPGFAKIVGNYKAFTGVYKHPFTICNVSCNRPGKRLDQIVNFG
ncbi:MAG TPA: hypothetical protein VEN30_14765, partial [Paraburkholderia sp.]|nr:hypothetical protein [Paraburkholderia sp.]